MENINVRILQQLQVDWDYFHNIYNKNLENLFYQLNLMEFLKDNR